MNLRRRSLRWFGLGVAQVVLLLPLSVSAVLAQDISVSVHDCAAPLMVTVTNLDTVNPVDAELKLVYAQYEDSQGHCNSLQDVQIASHLEKAIPAGGSSLLFLDDLDIGITVPAGCDTYVLTARASVPGTSSLSVDSCVLDPHPNSTLSLVDCSDEPYPSLIRGDLLFSNKIDMATNGTCVDANRSRKYSVLARNRPNLCGDGICSTGDGEDCVSCPDDCNGVQSGNPNGRYCCGPVPNQGETPTACSDPLCNANDNTCTDASQGGGSGTPYEAGIYTKYVCSTSANSPVACESVFRGNLERGRNKGSVGTGKIDPDSTGGPDFGPETLEPGGACLPIGYHQEEPGNIGRLPQCCDDPDNTKAVVQCAFFAVTRVGQDACMPAFLSPETKSVDLLSGEPLGQNFTCVSIQPDHSNVVLNDSDECDMDDDLNGVILNCPGDCNNDGVCDSNENCEFCPFDCSYVVGGDSFCCGDGVCEVGEACGFCDRECAGFTCCGDSVCEGDEDEWNCAVDCAAPFCGDNVKNGTEECDGTDLGGATCSDQGCTGGIPNCNPDCTLDFTSCTGCPTGCDNNGICNPSRGESCVSCPADCNGLQSGKPSGRFCCGDGDGVNPVFCSDPRCTEGTWSCRSRL